MTRTEFSTALQKGHGRAVIYVRNGPKFEWLDLLENAAVKTLAYDWQSEAARGQYVADMILALNKAEHFIDLIARVSKRTRLEKHLGHQLDVLLHLARADYAEARTTIQNVALQSKGEPPPGSFELIELDRLAGLEFLAREVKQKFKDDWFIAFWLEETLNSATKEEIQAALVTIDTPLAKQLRKKLESFDSVYADPKSYSPKPRKIPTIAAIRRTIPKSAQRARGMAIRLGRRGTDEELLAAASQLLKSQTADEVGVFSGAFLYRPFPLDIEPILNRINQSRGYEQGHWLEAISNVKDERVMQLCVELLGKGGMTSEKLEPLVVNSFPELPGFITTLLARNPPRGKWNTHGVVMRIRDLAGKSNSMDFTKPLLWAYEASPCSLCRGSVAGQLVKLGRAPAEVLEECVFDSDNSTRELALDALAANH